MTPVFALSIWLFAKLFFLFGLGLYIIFAAVVVRQIYIMTNALHVGFEVPVRLIGWINFFVAIGVFIFALALL